MGHESVLHLIAIRIKSDSLPEVKQAIEKRNVRGFTSISWYFELLMLDEENFLCLRAKKDGSDYYVPLDDGSVPADTGKWPDCQKFASWVKQHCEKGGRIVLHSLEGDGKAWGWEFNGKGKMRDLSFCSVGAWK